nr:hypothetical protein [Paenibacillus sp. RC343]
MEPKKTPRVLQKNIEFFYRSAVSASRFSLAGGPDGRILRDWQRIYRIVQQRDDSGAQSGWDPKPL